jgi:cyclopropane fatty-acyl-phospholipid synthase-like methyltransferase
MKMANLKIEVSSFDDLAENYNEFKRNSLRLSENFDMSIFERYKAEITARKIRQKPKTVLEFGCGIGANIPHLQFYFPNANFFGCDISEKSLAVAAKLCPSVCFNKIETPNECIAKFSNKFDLIFVANVFHHIPFAEHSSWINALYQAIRG